MRRYGNNDVRTPCIGDRWLGICERWPLAADEVQHVMCGAGWEEEYWEMYPTVREVAPGVFAQWYEDEVWVWSDYQTGRDGHPLEHITIRSPLALLIRINKAIKRLA